MHILGSIAMIATATNAHAWSYSDDFSNSAYFLHNFMNIYGVYGAGSNTSSMKESGNRFYRVENHSLLNTVHGDAKFMSGFAQDRSWYDFYAFYDPSVEGAFTNMQLDIDARFVSSVNGDTARLGILLLQGNFAFTGFSSTVITDPSWQHLSTGPITLDSFIYPENTSYHLDLSPTASPILVCFAFDIDVPDAFVTNGVTVDIDNPLIRTNVVPEPTTMVTFGIGLSALFVRRRRKSK